MVRVVGRLTIAFDHRNKVQNSVERVNQVVPAFNCVPPRALHKTVNLLFQLNFMEGMTLNGRTAFTNEIEQNNMQSSPTAIDSWWHISRLSTLH
jgi:hypothetical protein